MATPTPTRTPGEYLRPMLVFPDVKLLQHPQIPPSLWGVNPRNLYGKEWWDEVRHLTYRRYGYRCWACGVHSREAVYRPGRLDAHETYDYQGLYRTAEFQGTVGLCMACHEFIHRGHMKSMLLKGKIGQSKVDRVLQRGMGLLANANLRPLSTFQINDFQKEGWRLKIDGYMFSVDDLMRLRSKGPRSSATRRAKGVHKARRRRLKRRR